VKNIDDPRGEANFLEFWYKVQINLYTSTYLQSIWFGGGQLHNRMSISRIFFHNIWLCSWSIGGHRGGAFHFADNSFVYSRTISYFSAMWRLLPLTVTRLQIKTYD
jgi:hypothetical protein